MRFRNLLVGPSRVLNGLPQPCIYRPLQIRHITFPHPALDPQHGSTRLVVLATQPIPSMLHALSIVRAVESSLGAVWQVEVPRDPDSNSPLNMIFLTLLRPAKLPKPLHFEIPWPECTVGRGSDRIRFGGPSLSDVQAVLKSDPTKMERQKDGKVLQFKVEVRTGRERREREKSGRRGRPRTGEEIKEDEEILEALRKLGAGPYGGFEGLAERLAEDLAKKADQARQDGAASRKWAEEGAEEVVEEEAEEVAEKTPAEDRNNAVADEPPAEPTDETSRQSPTS